MNSSPKARSAARPKRLRMTAMRMTRNSRKPRTAGCATGIMPSSSYQYRRGNVRGFRLFRIIRIAVILSRFGRAADRAFGDEFTYRLLKRFKAVIVDTLSGAVTLRVLEETAQVLEKGTYAQNLADAIEARGDEMLELAVEKVKADPEVGAVRHLPFFEDVVRQSSRVTQRIAVDLLRDDRMEAILRDIIRSNVAQIQAAVKAKEAARETAGRAVAGAA